MKSIATIIIALFITALNTVSAQDNSTAYTRGPKLTVPATTESLVKVNPMQIADGIVTVQLINQPAGDYSIQLVDANGKVLVVKAVNHANGTSAEVVEVGSKLAGGMYQVEVVNPKNDKSVNKIILLM